MYDMSTLKDFYENAVRYVLRQSSELGRRALENPGSWDSIEYIYQNDPNGSIRNSLDHLFLKLEGSRALRNRMEGVKTELQMVMWILLI